MTDLPFQKWFESDFANDTKTLSFEDRCVYRAVLQVMWANHGWLPGNDLICARMLGCDMRTWRAYRKRLQAFLRAEVDPVIGPIWRQSRVIKDWADAVEVQAKNKERSAKAAAASAAVRSKKSSKVASDKLSSKHNGNGQLEAQREAQLGAARRALARKPEPEEPTSQGDEGSGPLPTVPAQPAARPPAAEGSGLAAPAVPEVEHFTGPFMPSAPAGPKPVGRSTFLTMLDKQWNGDAKAYNEWRAQQRATAAAIAQIDAAMMPEPEEEPDDERHDPEPERSAEPPDDDDLDDLIRF